jgi:hypothetical protein
MDEARAMLDQLMGKTRNLSDVQKDTIYKIHFSDEQVCKYYLCGLCPYIAFTGTKSDMGKCPYPICGDIDADTCRYEWNQLTQQQKDHYGYEYKLLSCLSNIIQQCDRKIEKHKLRSEQDMTLTEDDFKKISIMYKQIGDLVDQCEYYGEERGDIDRCMEIMKQIEILKEASRKVANPPEEKKITVCEVSGNFMSSRFGYPSSSSSSSLLNHRLFSSFFTLIHLSLFPFLALSCRDNDDRMRAHFEVRCATDSSLSELCLTRHR